MKIIETSLIGESVIKNHGCILVGLSIKNSYFKDENLKKILDWSSNACSHVYVMIPDKPAIYTLMSFGYEENRAKTKAGLESNRLENKCKRIIAESKLNNVSIVRWKDIEEDEGYLGSLKEIKSTYEEDADFKEAIRDTTLEVVSGNKTDLETQSALDIGVNFLFQELAFISNSANILKCKEVAYLYHKTMPIFKMMIEKKYKIKAAENVGFITAL